jgi:hypothetical protein
MDGVTEVHRYDVAVPLDALQRDAARAVDGWDWGRGAYGHALSLPAYRQLHRFARYGYANYPCTGLLDSCPAFRAIFDGLECEKVSFRLLRREPGSSYAWHSDSWKGPGVVRFQIPIVSDERAFLVTTDYTAPSQIEGSRSRPTGGRSFDEFARSNAGHFRRHTLEPGRLHYFDTNRVHTLVNPGPGERLTLSFDLLANHWLLNRYPETREEVGAEPPRLPRRGGLRTGIAFARSRTYPLRNRARAWRERRDPDERSTP